MSWDENTGDLVVERSGAIATLLLNRPDRRNAIRLGMYEELPRLVARLGADPAVKVLVVRGSGYQAFASGADISEFQEVRGDVAGARSYNERVAAAEQALAGLRKPTIAMVHGYCIGGGCGLALACDLRFADERARLAITAAKLGIVYGFASTKRLVDLVGPARAKWMLMSGESMDAETALRVGLVDEVLPADDLERHTYEFAELLAARAQFSVRAAKEIVGRAAAGQTEDDEVTTELRNSSVSTSDYTEGVRAFLEKRPPVFTWS
jgi:enoyl-CoA hydratase/carnithine racemase